MPRWRPSRPKWSGRSARPARVWDSSLERDRSWGRSARHWNPWRPLPHLPPAAVGILPSVGLELGAGTLHQSWSDKGNWTWAAVGLSWKVFSAPDRAKAQAARAQARAAQEMSMFKQQQADHEARAAQEAVLAAQAKVAAAKEAILAAEDSKRLREARHREGITPLTDVLDAEAALQGARNLLLQSLFDLRVNRAALDLATGAPIEGVTP